VKNKAAPCDPDSITYHTDEQRETLRMVPSAEELKASTRKEAEKKKTESKEEKKDKN